METGDNPEIVGELSCAKIGARVTMSATGVYNAGMRMGLPKKGPGKGQGLTDFDMEV